MAPTIVPKTFIDLSDSDDDDDSASSVSDNTAAIDDAADSRKRPSSGASVPFKKPKLEDGVLPAGFLDPLETAAAAEIVVATPVSVVPPAGTVKVRSSKQFWKAGDYEGQANADSSSAPMAGMDHVRVHPKFLHSNATSHKWALGALAELLDNSMDEVCHGATFVNIDMLINAKDETKMLLVEDNGGGMDPDRMRQCMSLGYSEKSKSANTIGQYGNGFKTSTMRLGADAIVFSRSRGKEGRSPTQSIGLLSYTFLRNTGKEDIVVPMIDYVREGEQWNKLTRASSDVWENNLETILQWSPYYSEADLLQQFNYLDDQGTRVIIYNLWDDDQGELELDFDADQHDIQVRGANRDEKKIQMAKQFPNSRHFLTYRHSLRNYTSILYLRIPCGFRMILRGKEIDHHNIVNDMMLKQEVTYRPQPGTDGVPKDPSMVAVVTIGFVKDAKDHIDVQGFNVYHKNRLIKPFWRLWNAAGSDGRGVIGVLEANFVEPAHDKQGFERTTVLARLEARLIQMQKTYWRGNCHKIGYASRQPRNLVNGSEERDSSPETTFLPREKSYDKYKTKDSTCHENSSKPSLQSSHKVAENSAAKSISGTAKASVADSSAAKSVNKTAKGAMCTSFMPQVRSHGRQHATNHHSLSDTRCEPTVTAISDENAASNLKAPIGKCNGNGKAMESFQLLTNENKSLKNRLKELEEKLVQDVQYERDRNKSLSEQVATLERQLEVANNEQEALINIFQEERSRRDTEERNLRTKLEDASATIQKLVGKIYSEPKSSIKHEQSKM